MFDFAVQWPNSPTPRGLLMNKGSTGQTTSCKGAHYAFWGGSYNPDIMKV